LDTFGWNLPKTGPYSKILEVDVPGEKIRYALLVSYNSYIELVEPKEGLWMKYLEERGEGAICELCIRVDDIKQARKMLERKGITPMDRFNKPLKEKYILAPSGARYFYLPVQKTFGTWIEILERPWAKERGTLRVHTCANAGLKR